MCRLGNISNAMEKKSVYSTLNNVLRLLEFGGSEQDYQRILKSLGDIVALTGENEEYRNAFAQDTLVLQITEKILRTAFSPRILSASLNEQYIRTARGLVLFARNLCASLYEVTSNSVVVTSIYNFLLRVEPKTPFFDKSFHAYLQLLANSTTRQPVVTKETLFLIPNIFTQVRITYIQTTNNPDLESPFIILMCSLLGRSHQRKYIFETAPVIIENLFCADIPRLNCVSRGSLLLSLQSIITCDIFGQWLQQRMGEDYIEKILHNCQLTLSSKVDWNLKEILTIVLWTMLILEELIKKSKKLLYAEKPNQAQISSLHVQIVRSLDVITQICSLEYSLIKLVEYNAVEMLISLFKAIDDTTSIRTPRLRTQNDPLPHYPVTKLGTRHSQIRLPMVKTLILEIFTNMSSHIPSVRDTIRDLHGLELILSSCVIDEDNPFIKEQAILCLKFLLQDNLKNQEFVAMLEAKQVVDADVLTQAGYEITISDGKVAVKNTEIKE